MDIDQRLDSLIRSLRDEIDVGIEAMEDAKRTALSEVEAFIKSPPTTEQPLPPGTIIQSSSDDLYTFVCPAGLEDSVFILLSEERIVVKSIIPYKVVTPALVESLVRDHFRSMEGASNEKE